MTVHVRDPLITVGAGVPVVFIDDEQTQVIPTDNTGTASATVLAGASVTAVVIFTQGARLETVLATAPGDDITLGQAAIDSSDAGTFTVSFPASSAPAFVSAPCNDILAQASPAVLTMKKDCVQSPMELLLNGVGGYIDVTVPFVPGGTTTLTPPVTPDVQVATTYTNVPSDVTRLSAGWIVGGGNSNTTAQPPTDPMTFTLDCPVGASAVFETTVLNAATAVQTVDLAEPTTTTSVTLDLASSLLPFLQTPTIDLQTNTIDAPVLSDGLTANEPDLFYMDFSYAVNAADPNGVQGVEWTVFGPAPGTIMLPVLPASVGDLKPASNPMPFVNTEMIIESSAVDGYAGARKFPRAIIFATPGVATRRTSAKPQI